MQSVVTCLETEVGDLWGELYGLSRDELIRLFKELDYAIHLECVGAEQRQVYARAAENLKEWYLEDE